MIYIFHGDDHAKSRSALNQLCSSNPETDVLRVESKSIDLDKINNYLNGQSFFSSNKVLSITNYFSIPKAIQDKLSKIIQLSPVECTIAIWQDKLLTATQLKTFPEAKCSAFKLDNLLFKCLYSVKPKNIKEFARLYQSTISSENYDLFLYFLKGSIRKQLSTYTKFEMLQLKKAYLHLIELDYQNKSGKLSLPKELALLRLLTPLMI